MPRSLHLPVCVLIAWVMSSLWAAEPFEIKAGDRVVVIGDTLFEREGVAAALEAHLYQRWAPRTFSVRNLSFAADRPDGVSRASFDPPGAGFNRLKEQLALVKPTVAIIGYGMAAALEEITYRTNDWTLNPDVARYGNDFTSARFQKDLNQLVEAITAANGAPVRLVFVAPIRPEDLRAQRPRLPDPKALIDTLAGYRAAIAAVAKERGGRYVDTPALTPTTETLTFNGIHPTSAGLERWAALVAGDLGWTNGGEQKWSASQVAALRAALVRKNDLFFHRWRPANQTYIFGFRKHEQGKNAVEIPQFDEFLQKADAAIATLVAGGDAPALPVKTAEKPADTAAPDPGFQLGENIAADLWAANPLISKPLHLNWDARGRLWVASTPIYPQIEPGAVASDRIFIVEDADHDGKADKSTVFADDLLIPSTVAPVERLDGKLEAYVGASTDLLLLSDTDGDGKADSRRTVLSGFGTEDTHHIIHTLYWGHDGRLYFNQSVYIHTHLETPWGVVRLNAGGCFAYDTQSERVEVLIKGLWNTWGHQMNDEGQSFFTDGAGFAGITWGFPGGVFSPSEGAKSFAPSITKGNYPKFAGLELIKSPLFPADWQGDAITCDFRAHRVVRMGINLIEGKSGYITNDEPDLLKTGDAWFRPIDVKLGPDGALYLADWSNPVSNHGEVDFRDSRRDHVHGRIWRVAPKDSMPLVWTPVFGRKVPELCEALLSANKWERESARRVLIISWNEVVRQQAQAWEKSLSADRQGIAAGVLAGVRLAGGERSSLSATAPEARTWAARTSTAAEALAAIDGASPRLRIELERSAARHPGLDSAGVLLRAARQPGEDDPHAAFALRSSLELVTGPLAAAIADGSWKTGLPAGTTEADLAAAVRLLPAERAAPAAQALLVTHADQLGKDPWGPLVAHAGDAAMVAKLFAAVGTVTAPAEQANILRWCAEAASRGVSISNEQPALATFLTSADQEVRLQAIRLAGLWKRADLAPALRVAFADRAVRKEALAALQGIGGEPVATELLALLGEAPNTSARAEILAVLAKVDGGKALAAATPLLGAISNDQEAATLWRVLWAGNGVIDRVVKDGLPAGLSPSALTAGANTAQELGGRGAKLVEKFADAKPKRPEVAQAADQPADLPGWVEYTGKNGIASKGEARYFGLNCQVCHSIGGAGGKLGPDLSTLGASAPLDYIIESVQNPSAKVKEGYHAVTFKLKDGTFVSGIPAGETDQELIVRMPGIEQSVKKSDIVSRDIGSGSLMPLGLLGPLPADDQAHLFAFLAQLGKPGPFDASSGTVARLLRLSGSLPEGTAPDLSKFQPAFANVDGRMTPRAWRAPLAAVEGEGAVYAMAQVEVPTDGLLTVTIEGTDRPWLDGIRFDPQETGRQVKAGRHTIAVSINREKPIKDLRIKVNAGRFVTP
ncbi:MAG TPA: PVC-type heme-binding CxxCH protein [Planctomycetota bacterium]|nr:PVC-type heme-binding CxxCH protein [Planctomycetota bacterium]